MILRTVILSALFAVTLAGCSNTNEGVKKDAEANAEKTSQVARDAGASVSESSKNLGAATMLTPKIKTALVADKLLNDSTNQIDVDSNEMAVKLSGHVTSESLKKLAGDIAQKVLDESSAKQTLDNKLIVSP